MKVTLAKINRETIASAGARYTPVVDPDAPNLTIEASVQVLDALSLNLAFRERLRGMASRIEEAWPKHSKLLNRAFQGRKQTPTRLASLLLELADHKPGTSGATRGAISSAITYCRRRTAEVERDLHARRQETRQDSKENENLRDAEYDVRKLSAALHEFVEFQQSPEFQCISNSKLLFLGEWGTGKTHLLCDITRAREDLNLPTLTVLAHRLRRNSVPLEAICEQVPSVASVDTLLTRLNRFGEKLNARALVIVDGVNEADRQIWAGAIPDLVRRFDQLDHVGLILSCRIPYEDQIFPKSRRSKFVQFLHPGFEGIEIDAQNEYFSHYDIPTPNVPLLSEEFSRPLFLKTLCKSLQSFADSTKRKKIGDLASGQKGMTTIFEDFIKSVGKGVEAEFGLPGLTCWRILKGNRIKGSSGAVGVAVAMADRQSDWVEKQEVLAIINAHTGRDELACGEILARMANDGLIAEDMISGENGWKDVVRMPYQRFSDHLICRHLLERYLKRESPETIRRSFYANQPLGRVFELKSGERSYREPGLASALMLEFPERIRRVEGMKDRELIFSLPSARRHMVPFVEAFLDGLVWRDADSFSDETFGLMFQLLERGCDQTKRKTLDTFACLASRSAHSRAAANLEEFMHGLNLIERDRLWSEYLRKCETGDTPYRILRWVEENPDACGSKSSCRALVAVLEWFLTATDRALRDRATRALVFIGEEHHAMLFERTLGSLARNDPYVSERMLAASYGVLMRKWWGSKGGFRGSSSEFARSIFDLMFARRGKHRSKHVLAREYALGIIHLSLKMSPNCLGTRDQDLLKAPFSTFRGKIPSPGRITDDQCAGADAAFRMDFENYTIGRLVKGRGNYDFEHPGYKDVRRQIEWRINDLGYRKELFSGIDDRIAQEEYDAGRSESSVKIDRYGKKYSWIAFYEVAGLVQDRSMTGSVFERERISDADIDPSFPGDRIEFCPKLKDLFRKKQSFEEWVGGTDRPDYRHLLELGKIDSKAGPWVLLDGAINEDGKEDARQVFTFLRGVLVAHNDCDKLVRAFRTVDYPGNDAIPRMGEDVYTFAGEVAWSPRYANFQFEPSRPVWSRQIEEALPVPRARTVRKPFGELDPLEQLRFQSVVARLADFGDAHEDKVQQSLPGPDELVEVVEHCRIPGVEVEVPVWGNSWESYHSVANQGGGFIYPAPALCEFLGLNSVRGEADLVDQNGNAGSVFRVLPTFWKHASGRLVYLRRDLLVEYLRHTRQDLVWLMWGERRIHHDVQVRFDEIWKGNGQIHRRSRKFQFT